MVEKNYDNTLIRCHPIPGRYVTDRRTYRQNFYISIARQYADARVIKITMCVMKHYQTVESA